MNGAAKHDAERVKIGTTLCSVLGICGAALCSFAMFAVPLGLFGAGIAAGAKADSAQAMSGMSGISASGGESSVPHWIAALNRYGPEVLVLSIMLLIVALTLRRSVSGAITAFVGGLILYAGMYLQPSITFMWAATLVGMPILLISLLGLRRSTFTGR